VIAKYVNDHIPNAIQLAQTLRKHYQSERFVWTTGSWLIHQFLQRSSPKNRTMLEKAISRGDITWHGLPFTLISEFMDVELFRFGLSLSQELDRQFGKQTISAKMTDVPGHTRGIVPLLAEAGIQFLHIGTNPATKPPSIPPVFRWRNITGAELIVMYHKGSYGDVMQVPGLDEAIAFAHTNDNIGPQSLEEVLEIFNTYQQMYPQAMIIASTMDAFAKKLNEVKDSLPQITQEIGDTWVHGIASDPTKVSQFRELLRLRSRWLCDGSIDPGSKEYKDFSLALLLVAEHTWGMDVKSILADDRNYRKDRFYTARSKPHFKELERSWVEQRNYINDAVRALNPTKNAVEAKRALRKLQPNPNTQPGYAKISPSDEITNKQFNITFNQAGVVNHLVHRDSKKVLADTDHTLGQIRYQTFSEEDYQDFYDKYIINKQAVINNEVVGEWAIQDFTKPGIAEGGAIHEEWLPTMEQILYKEIPDQKSFQVHLSLPQICYEEFGAPRKFMFTIHILEELPKITFDLQWFQKPACRLPEAIWFSFCPNVNNSDGWRIEKLGELISPQNVINNGNRKLHGIDKGVFYEDAGSKFMIESLDAPLVAPGKRSLLNFNNRQPPMKDGIHFLLYNNIWGTNFPMWFEEDARFRFVLTIQ
jgi:hypothetical protein